MPRDDSVFEDRHDAGRRLADNLERYRGDDVVVLGLARGGVVVAAEIAAALGAPLDVLVARKLGAPMHPEYGIGAVAPGGLMVLDEEAARGVGATAEQIERVRAREVEEVERRLELYRDGNTPPELRGKTVILADDGLATGVTAIAAVRYLRTQEPAKIVLAVPVCSWQGAEILSREADEVVCLSQPPDFRAVGLWYVDFGQTEDEEVIELLRRSTARRSRGSLS